MKTLKYIILPAIIALAIAVIISCSAKPPSGPGPAASPTPSGDIYENDDTPYQAKTIYSGAVLNMSQHACEDEDWVVFTISSISDMTLTVSGGLYPLLIEAYDSPDKSNGAFFAGDGSGAATAFVSGLAPGTYYTGIRAWNYAAPGCDIFNYTLSLSINSAEVPSATITMTYATVEPTSTITPIPAGADSYEPDDVYTQAKTISGGNTQIRNLHSWDDVDWIKFTLVSESDIDLSISGILVPQCPYLEAYPDPLGSPEFTFGYTSDNIYYTHVLPGIYYLKIRSAGTEGTYTLHLGVTPYPTGTPTYTVTPTFTITPTYTEEDTATATETPWTADAFEPDSTPGEARAFFPGVELNHSLFPAGDEDWYSFTLAYPGEVTISATAGPQGWDMRMNIFNDYNLFTPIQAANGGFPDGICWLVHTFAAGTYLVRITDESASSPMDYDIFYGATVFTPTPAPSPDAYEPDDNPLDPNVRILTPEETQYRSMCPANDIDIMKFIVTYPSVVSVSLTSTGPSEFYNMYFYEDSSLSVSVGGTGGAPPRSMSHGFDTPGTYYLLITSFPGPLGVFPQYNMDIFIVTMTPSPTFTVSPTFTDSPTATGTNTVSPTMTASPTATSTPTIAPTMGAWAFHLTGAQTGATNPALASDGSSMSFGYFKTPGSLFVNDTNIPCSTLQASLGKKWLAKYSGINYITYPFSTGAIQYRTSSNWSTAYSVGGSGFMPCIYLDAGVPYVAYADSTAGNSVTVRYINTVWTDYGSPDFTPPAAINGYNSVAIGGYNDGTLRLYVAYIDTTNGNKVGVMWKNGAAAWANLGTGLASDEAATNLDISVLDGSHIYVIYSIDPSRVPAVKQWNGTSWIALPYPLIAQCRYNSIYAAAENEIYVSFYSLTDTRVVAKKYDGSGWIPLNYDFGFTPVNVSYSSILKSAGTLYSGFIDAAPFYMQVYKYE